MGATLDREVYEVRRDGLTISTDKARLDRDAIWRVITETYWSKGMTRFVFERSVAGALCFGLYDEAGAQLGFARVVSDGVTVAWLSDVFVLPGRRGKGIGQWFVASIMAHPELQHIRRWMLATRDAHSLYARLGFGPVDAPRLMTRLDPEAHKWEG
jgi:GNAT superfamily N-acetyltransferase